MSYHPVPKSESGNLIFSDVLPKNWAIYSWNFPTCSYGQYSNQGVGDLNTEKLSELLELKYRPTDAGAEKLGGAQKVREAFI